MFRVCFLILTILISTSAYSSTLEYRDYGDNKCQVDKFNPEDLNVDLTAKIDGQIFGTYKAAGISTFEYNMLRAKNGLNYAVAQCLKLEDGTATCRAILENINVWQNKNYLISKSEMESADWWEESFQTTVLLHTMLEALSIANEQLNNPKITDPKFTEWLLHSLKMSRKDHLVKANQRTAWVAAAAKAAIILDRPIPVGFRQKSAEELIEDELRFQFGLQREDGSLPYEAERGVRAVWYTGRQISYLITLMEMGEKLGLQSYKKHGNQLNLAIEFVLDAIENPEIIYPYAQEMFASPDGDPMIQDYGSTGGELAGTFGFAKIYISRFPNHRNVEKIKANKHFVPFVKFDIKMTNGIGIDIGCLNPSVSKTTTPKTLNTSTIADRFACFMTEAKSQKLEHLPTDEQINALIVKVKESGKSQATRVDLTKYRVLDTMTRMEHMDPILNLLNFEGTLDEFCANPIDRTVITAPSKF